MQPPPTNHQIKLDSVGTTALLLQKRKHDVLKTKLETKHHINSREELVLQITKRGTLS